MQHYLHLSLIVFFLSSPLLAVKQTPISKPWLRLPGDIAHIKIDPKARFLAFTNEKGQGLKVLELATKKIITITEHFVGPSFFWSPDGMRLFYRQLVKQTKTVKSELAAFDWALKKHVSLAEYPYPTGMLTFDPRDLRLHLYYGEGIHTKRIFFPNDRLARWQIAQRTQQGKWVVSQKKILWITDGGLSMNTLDDDNSGIQSFDISPDGSAIAWATKEGNIYVSDSGSPAKQMGTGYDPSWHPIKPVLLYAAARKVGPVAIDYDLRIINVNNKQGRYLQVTQGFPERWPVWSRNGEQIIYTRQKSTDLYTIKFRSEK